jgi:hypothetical protein
VTPIADGGINHLINKASTGTTVVNQEQFSLKPEGQYIGSQLFPIYHPEVIAGARVPTLTLIGVPKEPLLQSPSFRGVEHIDSPSLSKWETILA